MIYIVVYTNISDMRFTQLKIYIRISVYITRTEETYYD